jgi:hypothetical protein
MCVCKEDYLPACMCICVNVFVHVCVRPLSCEMSGHTAHIPVTTAKVNKG